MKQPLIMGVLNVTPDSFSDGGQFNSLNSAIRRTDQMVSEGADIIDVGGESTRPGALPISVELELDRVYPVICEISKRFSVRVSVDTQKFEVAKRAVEAGATLINDVSGGSDSRMGDLLKNPSIGIILMHMKGSPDTMQKNPIYSGGVVSEVRDFLRNRVYALRESGIEHHQIWVDPGIGFGKSLEHNLDLLKNLNLFTELSDRVVIGTSRKSMLAQIAKSPMLNFTERLSGTLASNLWAYQMGASVFRVHDVGEFKKALAVWGAIENGCL